jgi:hypothetical protein
VNIKKIKQLELRMELYGKEDENFGDMGDNTDRVYISVDFNTIAPFIQKKPAKAFSICENSFEELFNIFKNKLTFADKNRSLIIFMRVNKKHDISYEKIEFMGESISKLFSEDSLVTWAIQGYDRYSFDFYFYD